MTSPKKKNSPPQTPADISEGIVPPLVFISHDTRDADLAEAFANLLTDASGGVLQSFRSSDRKGTAGIEFGAEWYAAIMSKLSNATDVVALLTFHSLERPWILYEAGVAKGKLDTTVLGLAINVPLEKANGGPFAQFQNCADDEDSLTKLVLQLIRKNPNASPREQAVRLQVKAFLENVKAVTEKKAKAPITQPKVDENAIAKMFEEVKILMRDLPERVAGVPREFHNKRKPRLHPMMLEDALHFSMHRDNNPALGLLVLFSYFRDTHPWLYELGKELYSAFNAGNNSRIERVKREMASAFDLLRHSPLSMELKEDDEMFYFLRHLPERLDQFLPRRKVGIKRSQSTGPEHGPL